MIEILEVKNMIGIILGKCSVMVSRFEEFKNKNVFWLRECANKGDKNVINELLLRVKSYDEGSIAETIGLYEGLSYNHDSRFFLNGYDVEDLEQVARCIVIESVHKFDKDFG